MLAFIPEVRIMENGEAVNWTGHSSYSSMKPYIDIVDAIKATEMTKMNFMD